MTQRELNDLLRDHAHRHGVPGAAVGVLLGDTETVTWCGVANTQTGERVTADSRFGVGSLTKSMVATVVARLAAAGRLSLEDPVAAHVPELGGADWAQTATVRDLLANRSRLPLRADLEFDFTGAEAALSTFAASVATAEPATVAWSYTNAGWCLLGRIIETATGGSWEDAMRAGLLDPARMRGAGFTASRHRVSGHDMTTGGPVPVEAWSARTYGPAGTTMTATAADVLRFAAVHLEDPALAMMRETHAEPRIDGWLDGWCLGWARFDWHGGPVWGWDSVLSGERAVLRIVPDQQAAVVVMTNAANGRALCRSLLADVMPAYFGIAVPPLRLTSSPGAAGDLSRFAGEYAWPDRRVKVTAADGRLVIDGDGEVVEAVPLDQRTFLVDADDPDTPTLTFGEFGDDGRPGVLYRMLWALPRIREY